MPAEIKDAVEQLNKAFGEFKEANDKRISDIAKNQADVLNEIKVNKINDKISELTDTVNNIQKSVNRQGLNAEASAEREEKAKYFAKITCTKPNIELVDAYGVAFDSYMRRAAVQDAMSVGGDSSGGYLVTPDMSGRMVSLMIENSPMRELATVVTTSSDTFVGPVDSSDMGCGWVGEEQSRVETGGAGFGEYKIPVHEIYAEPRVTQKLLDDASFDVEAYLEAKIAEKLAYKENDAFVNGSGVGKPRGFLTYASGTPSTTKFDVIEQVKTGASGAFASSNPGDKLIDLVYSLKAPYRTNAKFVLAKKTLSEVRKLKDGNGNYLWQPDFQQSKGGLLLGYEAVEAEAMPAIAANSLSIAFGDFKAGYQIVDRMGVRVLRDGFTAKPYVKFYTTKRVGGDVVNFEAIKLLKFAA